VDGDNGLRCKGGYKKGSKKTTYKNSFDTLAHRILLGSEIEALNPTAIIKIA
jgi:hypothetical protein